MKHQTTLKFLFVSNNVGLTLSVYQVVNRVRCCLLRFVPQHSASLRQPEHHTKNISRSLTVTSAETSVFQPSDDTLLTDEEVESRVCARK